MNLQGILKFLGRCGGAVSQRFLFLFYSWMTIQLLSYTGAHNNAPDAACFTASRGIAPFY